MKIDDMFKQYPENLIGFRVGGGIKIIDFWLDPNWQILDEHVPEDVKIKKQKVSEDTGFVYYIMFCEEKQLILAVKQSYIIYICIQFHQNTKNEHFLNTSHWSKRC